MNVLFFVCSKCMDVLALCSLILEDAVNVYLIGVLGLLWENGHCSQSPGHCHCSNKLQDIRI